MISHVKARGNVPEDRKSTRLNSSHANISYAVFCLEPICELVHRGPSDNVTSILVTSIRLSPRLAGQSTQLLRSATAGFFLIGRSTPRFVPLALPALLLI